MPQLALSGERPAVEAAELSDANCFIGPAARMRGPRVRATNTDEEGGGSLKQNIPVGSGIPRGRGSRDPKPRRLHGRAPEDHRLAKEKRLMRTRSRLLLIALAATTFMSIATSAASARRFEESNQLFRLIWTLLRFEVSGTTTVQCPVTLEGSFHSRTYTKVSGLLIGYVTRAFIRGGRTECLNTGIARMNTETLPWHVQYLSFRGALPNITEVKISLIGADINVDPEGAVPNCRARSSQAAVVAAILLIAIMTATERELRVSEASRIPLTGGLCELAGEANLSGTAEVFVLGSTTSRIQLHLIQ
jgi:hypothetical protein